ncbi:MAG TPA: hypothetical protein VKR55_06280 [Bradyrhizobium sp.]|uniref:hypothetical protein n=1 Tax=Bradyrhizobium sp. TaxID=376 RepID=UPI002C9A4AB4|nr:hypothetical protein [Bradyrhizobium sp.]HLZ01745.1 hypothetical protein [Bradyrhizobium sp.]
MAARSKAHFVPPLDTSLLKRLRADDDNWWLEEANDNIAALNKLLQTIPPRYTWQSLTADAFAQVAKSRTQALSADEAMLKMYRLYWHDMLSQIEAFTIMSAWRLADLTRSAVWAVRRSDVLCAAIMSRAALETTAAYSWLQTEIRPALEKVAASNSFNFVKYHDQGEVKDLEDKLLKVIHASRLSGQEDFYKPTNITTVIDKIADKIPEQRIVRDTYSKLCEVAHPNWAGRSLYITETKPNTIFGHELHTISSHHGPTATIIAREAVTALSWSTGTYPLSCVALQSAIQKMVAHLKHITI